MGWNEPPNNNKGKKPDFDPWRGNNRGNQSPPDLDEFLKGIQDSINRLFGGKKSTGGGGSGSNSQPPKSLKFIVISAFLFLFGLWFANGIYVVEQAEEALILRFGKFHTINTAGLHWSPYLIDQVLKINTNRVISHEHRASMLTEDQNIITMEMEVQYRVFDPRSYFLKVTQPELVLKEATESSLRHVVGGTKMDDAITVGREIIAIDVKERLQEYLDQYETGLMLTKVNIKDAHPPDEVKQAFDDVIKAREDEERFKEEARAYANKVVPEAEGRAKRIIEDANAYHDEIVAKAEGEGERFEKLLAEYQKAPEITRKRLYLESMEKLYQDTTKVLMMGDNGNNLTLMPLDKLIPAYTAAKKDPIDAINFGQSELDEIYKNSPNEPTGRSTNFRNQIRQTR